jgi:hypothetical protein
MKYIFQGSGEGYFSQLCSDEYCEECNTSIKEALSKIPIKNVKRYVKFDRNFDWDLKNAPTYKEVKKEFDNKAIRMYCMINWDTPAISYSYKWCTLFYTKNEIFVNAMVDKDTEKVIGYTK